VEAEAGAALRGSKEALSIIRNRRELEDGLRETNEIFVRRGIVEPHLELKTAPPLEKATDNPHRFSKREGQEALGDKRCDLSFRLGRGRRDEPHPSLRIHHSTPAGFRHEPA
jgi:hypothetical protein